jgi:hypothetical protein
MPIMTIDPTCPALGDEEARVAYDEMSLPLVFRQVVRSLADPPIVGQTISLFSFIPHPEAVASPQGRFGYIKMRGNFGSECDAKHYAYNLIKNYDSFHKVVHVRTGNYVPLGACLEKIAQIDEVQLNAEMSESISKQVEKTRQDDASKIKEIEEQARILKDEEKQSEDDPLTVYIQTRVKYATLKMTYLEHQKKLAEIVPILVAVRDHMERMDGEDGQFREQFYDKYMLAYKRAGLDNQPGTEMSEAFLRYIKEDIVLPF